MAASRKPRTYLAEQRERERERKERERVRRGDRRELLVISYK